MDLYSSQDRIWTTHGKSNAEDGFYTKRLTKKHFECTKFHICVAVALIVLVIVLLCLVPIYLHLSTKKAVSSDFDLLVEHRFELESKINAWKRENGSSSTIEHITQHGFMMQEVVYKLTEMSRGNLTELQSSPSHQNMFRDIIGDICPETTSCSSVATSSSYRTIDGRCNNLLNPEWGMAEMAYRRDLPPSYSDGIGAPRMYGVDGRPLPSSRTVSNVVHQARTGRQTDTKTVVMVMAFGQFLSHDVVSTPTSDGPHSSALNCCQEPGTLSGPFKACFNIEMDYTDEFFGNSKCMKFTRSAPARCTNCEICGREQINEVTSYIDASNVYGSSNMREKSLRKYRNGLLLVNDKTNLLPWQPVPTCKGGQQPFCFAAGDMRATVVPNLSTLHTIFVRLHNLLALELFNINPTWTDEMVFQEARQIVIAIMQNIVYSEYLPVVLGPETMKNYDLDLAEEFRSVYNRNTNPHASNAFGTAAFRFGHATIPDTQILLDVEYKTDHVSNIEDTYNNPNLTVNSCGGLARWLVHHKGVVNDGLFSKGVRNLLFLDRTKSVSFDLVALNIQRGRDHGLPSYNKWRQFCKFPVITETQFKQPGTAVGDFTAEVADKFRQTYRHPDDIDLFSGGVQETVLQGAQVGPTFACILGDNFSRIKTGDRFFFENPDKLTGFDMDQLKTIKRLKFAKVICKTMEIDRIPENVFNPSSVKMVDCSEMNDIDMSLWMSNKNP